MVPQSLVYWTSYIQQPKHWSTSLDLKMPRYLKLSNVTMATSFTILHSRFEKMFQIYILLRNRKSKYKILAHVLWLFESPFNGITVNKRQVGDGTTTVTLLAGEFMKQAKPYIEDGMNSQIIIRSFRKATAFVSCLLKFLFSNRFNVIIFILLRWIVQTMVSRLVHIVFLSFKLAWYWRNQVITTFIES